LAQDDYYYEIQLTNKQLVFYFMAAATGLILSFLAGVMVGSKSVETSANELQAARPPAAEDRIVAEETPSARPSAVPSAQDLTYSKRLESEKVDDSLERGKESGSAPARSAAAKPAPVAEKSPAGKSPAERAPADTPSPAPKAASAKAPPAPTPKPSSPPAPDAQAKAASAAPTPAAPSTGKVEAVDKHAPSPAPGTFYVQVGAYKDKATADKIVAQLKRKDFAAYGTEGPGGLFIVRVGSYAARADAEQAETKLRDQKFKPYISKN